MGSNPGSQAGLHTNVNGTDGASIGQNADAESIAKERPSFKYESVEKAKSVLAKDRRARFEAARAYRLRENEILRQQVHASEEEAREQLKRSQETMEEHAARLMEEMKKNVIARFESDLYATVRTNVSREFDAHAKAGLKKALRNEVYEELHSELKPVVEAELADKLCESVRMRLEEELKPIIEAQIMEQLRRKENLNQTEMRPITTNFSDEVGHSSSKEKLQEPAIDTGNLQDQNTFEYPQPQLDNNETLLYPDLSHFGNGIGQLQSENGHGEVNGLAEPLHLGGQLGEYTKMNGFEELNDNSTSISPLVNSSVKPSSKRSFEDENGSVQSLTKRSKIETDICSGQNPLNMGEPVHYVDSIQGPNALSTIASASNDLPSKIDADLSSRQPGEDDTVGDDLDNGNAELIGDVNVNHKSNGEEMKEVDADEEEPQEDHEKEEYEQVFEGEEEEEAEEEVDEEYLKTLKEKYVLEGDVEEVDEEEVGSEEEDSENEEVDEEAEGDAHPYDEEEIEEEYEEQLYEQEDEALGEEEAPPSAQKSMIAVSNTQDTAFVIDDSDEEDADKTLVVEAEESTKVMQGKSIFDGSSDEDEDEDEDEEGEDDDEEEEIYEEEEVDEESVGEAEEEREKVKVGQKELEV